MRIGETSNIGGVSAPAAVGLASVVATARPAAASATSSPAASPAISRVGDLLNRLQVMAQSDPAQFASLAMQTSHDLQSLAGRASDPQQGTRLKDLSTRFANAARSGDPAALMRLASAGGAGSSHADASALSAAIDAAFDLRPPPLGPWFPK